MAKHTDEEFFKRLISGVSTHLNINGLCYLILPLDTAELAKNITLENNLFVRKKIDIYSYEDSAPHREILVLSLNNPKADDEQLVIYDKPKVYTKQYQGSLKDFFIIFE